jgi:signal transduction histidine kinase
VPFSVTQLFGPDDREQLDATMSEEPEWWIAAGVSGAILVTGVAVGTYATAAGHIRSPTTLAILLAVAVAPFIVQLKLKITTIVCALWTLAALAALNLFGSPLGTYDPHHGRDQISLMILVWLVGGTAAVANRRDVAIVVAAACVITVGRTFTDPTYGSPAIWAVGVGLALLAGMFIRTLTVALLNAKLAQTALSEQATTAERQRIAREVHDVIAHSLTVTMLHLTAARLAVGRGDSTAATEALEEAERAGRTSLNEIRHTVGLLRADGEPETTPQPSADDVPALVEGYRAAGLDVALHLRGDLAGIEPAAGLALYRIVQESLTNAGRHSPGAHTTVRITTGPPLQVDVQTEGGPPLAQPGSGLGLVGMAERAAALGGIFEAGSSGAGWRVAATLP